MAETGLPVVGEIGGLAGGESRELIGKIAVESVVQLWRAVNGVEEGLEGEGHFEDSIGH